MALANRAGLDLSQITWSNRVREIAREALSLAASSGRMRNLIEEISGDESIPVFHHEIRSLVGEEWMREHGIPSG